MPHLLIQNGSNGSQRFSLDQDVVTIGRHPESSLVFHDASVSSMHAEILRAEKSFVLRDLNSANGTTVNGKRVSEIELIPGDLLHFGPVQCVFRSDETGKDIPDVDAVTSAPRESSRPLLWPRLVAVGRAATGAIGARSEDRAAQHELRVRSGRLIDDVAAHLRPLLGGLHTHRSRKRVLWATSLALAVVIGCCIRYAHVATKERQAMQIQQEYEREQESRLRAYQEDAEFRRAHSGYSKEEIYRATEMAKEIGLMH